MKMWDKRNLERFIIEPFDVKKDNIYMLEFQVGRLRLFGSPLMTNLKLINDTERHILKQLKVIDSKVDNNKKTIEPSIDQVTMPRKSIYSTQTRDHENYEQIGPRLIDELDEEMRSLRKENIHTSKKTVHYLSTENLEEYKRIKASQRKLLKKVNAMNFDDLNDEELKTEISEISGFYEGKKGQNSSMEDERSGKTPNRVKVIFGVYNYDKIEIDSDQFTENIYNLQKLDENPLDIPSSLSNNQPETTPTDVYNPVTIFGPYLEELPADDPFRNDLAKFLEYKNNPDLQASIKKILITSKPQLFVEQIEKNPIFIGVTAENDPINSPFKLIGITELFLNDLSFISVAMTAITASVTPQSASKQEILTVMNNLDEIIGEITVFVRLSCFGSILREELPEKLEDVAHNEELGSENSFSLMDDDDLEDYLTCGKNGCLKMNL